MLPIEFSFELSQLAESLVEGVLQFGNLIFELLQAWSSSPFRGRSFLALSRKAASSLASPPTAPAFFWLWNSRQSFAAKIRASTVCSSLGSRSRAIVACGPFSRCSLKDRDLMARLSPSAHVTIVLDNGWVCRITVKLVARTYQ